MDIETTKSEQPKTILKEKVKRKYPTKAELLRLASSQELINCYSAMEKAAREGAKSCYLIKECDYSLSNSTVEHLLNAGIDLSQNCILFEKGTIPNALYSVRAYFDDSAHGVKRLWKEPTAKL